MLELKFYYNSIMEKNEKTAVPEKATREMVRDWVKRDVSAAHYFMGVLMRYPEVIDRMADEIFEHANKKENGAAIDHLKSEHHG